MGDDPEHGLSGALGLNQARETAQPEDEEPDLFANDDLLVPADIIAPRRPGKPKGARNKRNQEIADYILSRYRDPLIGLADVVSTPVPMLAKLLNCKAIEAAEFWRKCAAELALYVHQKQPTAVHVKSSSAGFIAIVDERQASALEGGENPFIEGFAGVTLTDEKAEQNQDDSEDDDE